MLVNQNIPNVIGGVSQQAHSQRIVNQVSEQINCFNSVVDGSKKRPNTTYKGALNAATSTLKSAYIHRIQRDAIENYVVAVDATGIKVHDADNGNEYPVTYTTNNAGLSSKDYLKLERGDVDLTEKFAALTSADTTFILNKTKAVTTRNTETAGNADAIVKVLSVVIPHEYGALDLNELVEPVGVDQGSQINHRLYAIKSIEAKFTFTESGTSFVTPYVNTEQVAAELAVYLSTLPAYTDYTFSAVGNEVHAIADVPINITVTDESTMYCDLVAFSGHQGGLIQGTLNTNMLSTSLRTTSFAEIGTKHEAMAYIKQTDYSVKYTLQLENDVFHFTTPEATSAQARAGLSIANILKGIHSGGVVIDTPEQRLEVTPKANHLYIKGTAAFQLGTSDDLSTKAFKHVKDKVQLFSELPPYAPDNFVVEVTGSSEEVGTSYWVKFAQDSLLHEGVWEEYRDPNAVHYLDRATMPHVLLRKQAAEHVAQNNPLGIYFEFTEAPFEGRLVGDDISNPMPSFVSTATSKRYINGMTFHMDRLAFASDENVILSETGNFYNFFATTVQTQQASAPIDVGVLSKTLNPIRNMLSTRDGLITVGTTQMFLLRSPEMLTLASLEAVPLLSYDIDADITPVVIGNSAYLVSNNSGFNSIFELNLRSNLTLQDMTNLTAHCPEYIKGKVKRLIPCGAADVLLVLMQDGTVYLYNYKWNGNEKAQSAWSKWTFNLKPIAIHASDSELDFIMESASGDYTFEQLTFSVREQTSNVDVILDSLQEVAVGTGAALVTNDARIVFNHDGREYIGYLIVQSIKLSRFYMRENNIAILDGRLQLRKVTVAYARTSSFKTQVDIKGRDTRTDTFEGRIIGSPLEQLGKIPIVDGKHSTPLLGSNEYVEVTLINDTPHDFQLQSLEWEGFYHNRARRI